jgi:hypothetical protein
MSDAQQNQVNNIYLPIELVRYILSFAPIVSPTSVCIKRVIDVYNEDHHWDLTKCYKKYYIKNIMPFSSYYWFSREVPHEFNLGPDEYDRL